MNIIFNVNSNHIYVLNKFVSNWIIAATNWTRARDIKINILINKTDSK